MSTAPSTAIQKAAQILAEARRTKTKITNIPESCRPTDNDAVLAIQQQTLALLGESVGGWKAGLLPTPGMIMAAPIPTTSLYRESPVPVQGSPSKIEPEIAFVLGKDITPRSEPYSEEEIRASIGDTLFVLELIGSRFKSVADVTHLEILADAYQNYGLFIGPSVPGALDQALESRHVKITSAGNTIVDREGKHPSGHPLKSFAWLINYLAPRGYTLKAGEIITTGSYAGIVEVPTGQPLHIELGGIGAIDVTLNDTL